MTKQILIIEDDATLVELVRIHLRDLPGELIACRSGLEGLKRLAECPVDLCILDILLPGMDGVEICRRIREQDVVTPILMLTAKSDESDKVVSLEAGADDYITKPFGVQEFMARVKALLRRAEQGRADAVRQPETDLFRHRDLLVDRRKRSVSLGGKRIELTPKEYELLSLLAEHPGKSYSRKELLKQIWGYTFEGYEHTVTAHVNRLRSKIEPDFARPVYILTTWGVGYRFAESDQTPVS